VTKSENIILLNTCSKGEVEDWGDEKPVEKSIGEAIGQNIKRLRKAKSWLKPLKSAGSVAIYPAYIWTFCWS